MTLTGMEILGAVAGMLAINGAVLAVAIGMMRRARRLERVTQVGRTVRGQD